MKYYPICDQCVNGDGDECHTPECVFCFSDTPKVSMPEFGVDLSKYAKIVDVVNNPDEAVNFVGVHPILFQKMKNGIEPEPDKILGFRVE